jgi:hypothetical protein
LSGVSKRQNKFKTFEPLSPISLRQCSGHAFFPRGRGEAKKGEIESFDWFQDKLRVAIKRFEQLERPSHGSVAIDPKGSSLPTMPPPLQLITFVPDKIDAIRTFRA